MGADAILVILPDVGGQRMREMQDVALDLGMDVLTEVRTESEVELAVECGAYMIGINQRDDPKDTRFTVDYTKAERMAAMFERFDDGILWIALSGMGVPGGTPLSAVADAGYDAALIGEALVTARRPHRHAPRTAGRSRPTRPPPPQETPPLVLPPRSSSRRRPGSRPRRIWLIPPVLIPAKAGISSGRCSGCAR